MKIDIYIHQININNTYLNIELKYEFYTKKFTNFESDKKFYQHLNCALYNLK